MQKIELTIKRKGKVVKEIVSDKSVIGGCIDLAAAVAECMAGDEIVAYRAIPDDFLGLLLKGSTIEIKKEKKND